MGTEGFEPSQQGTCFTGRPDSPTSAHPLGVTGGGRARYLPVHGRALWPVSYSHHRRAYPRRASNPRPPVCRTGAPPVELHGHVLSWRGRASNPQRVPGESRATLPTSSTAPCVGLARFERATPRIRTECSDQAEPQPADIRTRTGSRTPRKPGSGPGAFSNLAIRAEWTTSVSNRASAVCKTALHTCASPESQRSDSNRQPPPHESGARTVRAALAKEPVAGLEPAASRLQGGCSSCRASPAIVPSAGVEPALTGISGRRLSRWATWALPRLDSNQAFDVQSVASYRIDDEEPLHANRRRESNPLLHFGRVACHRGHPDGMSSEYGSRTRLSWARTR